MFILQTLCFLVILNAFIAAIWLLIDGIADAALALKYDNIKEI